MSDTEINSYELVEKLHRDPMLSKEKAAEVAIAVSLRRIAEAQERIAEAQERIAHATDRMSLGVP